MSIIIRLQNLPWAATCMDIRRYFWGLSIPEGGVHIVGGEMGDAFIGFSTDEDARQAMSRDGGKIHEMQIRLLLSSHAEMMRVIEKARQQNMSLQAPPPLQPPPIAPAVGLQLQPPPLQPPAPLMQQQQQQLQQQQLPPVQQQPPESDRGRRGRSPSPARRPRERSPPRSSSSRRSSSKRDRSRTPPRGSRSASSERRRVGRRDDRRYDDRYRDDRYRKDNGDRRYHDPPATNSPSYSSYESSRSKPTSAYSSDRPSDKGLSASAASYTSGGPSYDSGSLNKPPAEDFSKRPRRSRFDPEPSTTSSDIPFFDAEQKNKLAEALRAALPLVSGKQPGPDYSSNSNSAWPQQTPPKQESHPQNVWPNIEKRHPHQGVVPMDLESSPTSSPPDSSNKIIVGQPYNSAPRNSHSFVHGSNEMSSRHHPAVPDQKDKYSSNKPQQWSAPAPTSVTVEVRGVPPNVEVNEVLNLFHSASLTPANVFILTNPRGEADKALVQFHKLSDAEAGLARQPCYIRNFCCEVVSCPDALFKAAVANAMKPAFKPRPAEEERCVQLTGLSYSCKESDVVRFFGGLHIQDMAMNEEKNSAYVQFSTDQDYHHALSMSGKILGHEYVTISTSNKEMLNAARASSESRRGPNNFGPPHPNRRPHIEKQKGPMHENGPPIPPLGRPQNFAVHLRDLPEHTTDKAINDFFNKTGICVKAIHILLTPENIPSGEGFIEVGSKEEAEIALTRHKGVFLGQPILVTPIPYHEMNLILNRPPLLPTPEDEERAARRPEGPFNEPEFDRPPNGRPPLGDFGPPVRGERPFSPRFPKDRPRGDFRPERPFFPRQRGERPRMDGPPMRGPRPPMRPPFNRMRGHYPPRPRGPWDPSRAREQGEIGAPGCVVNIDNLHFDAGFEEILEFFKGYGILRDNIIRKYDEHKNPTSKARVAFHNPWDAERAVRELNHQKIKGRSLKLSIL